MAPSRASASRALLRAFLARARASTAPPRARVAPWRVLEPRLEPARAAGAVARSPASWSSIVRSPRGFAGASAGRERKKSPLPAPLEDETEGEEEKDARKTTTTEPTKEEARRAGEGDEDAKKLAAPARFSDLEDVSARAVALLAARVCWLKYVTLGVFKFMYDPHFHVSPLGGCEFTTNAKRAYRRVHLVTPVPIRPRSRGARRSLRGLLLPGVRFSPPITPRCFQSRHTATPLNSPTDAFKLHPDVASYGQTPSGSSWTGSPPTT